jgi:hypothetical protein
VVWRVQSLVAHLPNHQFHVFQHPANIIHFHMSFQSCLHPGQDGSAAVGVSILLRAATASFYPQTDRYCGAEIVRTQDQNFRSRYHCELAPRPHLMPCRHDMQMRIMQGAAPRSLDPTNPREDGLLPWPASIIG